MDMPKGKRLSTIGFDADDTLWHNERFFQLTQERFAELLADYVEAGHLGERLLEAERRNLGRYGYGIKGFVLSMIETALDVTGDSVPASVVRDLIDAGHEMLEHPIDLLPHVGETLEILSRDRTLVLITKGDLLDQERKLAQSGLGDLFDAVEIVAEKTETTYTGIFSGLCGDPAGAMMVGNSLKSDVLPALAVGAHAVHVPHELTWALEHSDAPLNHERFHALESLDGLLTLVEHLENS